jgi:hypothetical protein
MEKIENRNPSPKRNLEGHLNFTLRPVPDFGGSSINFEQDFPDSYVFLLRQEIVGSTTAVGF